MPRRSTSRSSSVRCKEAEASHRGPARWRRILHTHGEAARSSAIERRGLHALQPSKVRTRSEDNHRGELRKASQPVITAARRPSSKKQGGAPSHLTVLSEHECITEHAAVLGRDPSEGNPPRTRGRTVAPSSCSGRPEAHERPQSSHLECSSGGCVRTGRQERNAGEPSRRPDEAQVGGSPSTTRLRPRRAPAGPGAGVTGQRI